MAAIEATGLTKSFGGRTACRDVSFSVEPGEVFGLLGPNGAGKTTTLRILAGLYAPDAGTAVVAGHAISAGRPGGAELRRRVGLLTEQPGFYDRLTARENLRYFADLQSARPGRVASLLQRFGLAEHADRPFAELSRGMKQKLAIARALVHEPAVILLDEPTVGLDPEATREVRSVIAELSAEKATIVLCTHHLDEVERLCSRAAFIAGRLVGIHEIRGEDLLRIELSAPFAPDGVRAMCKSLRVDGTSLFIEPLAAVPDIVAALVAAGARIESVAPHRDPLEDAVAAARRRGALVIGLVLRKELLELRRSPVLLLSMASLPATVVVVPVGLLAWLVHAAPEQALAFVTDVYGVQGQGLVAGVTEVLARNWLPMFLVLPIFLPILLAAQSIGGERERRTLEPLLATPVSTLSIILGKSIAALVPALGITWIAAGLFCAGMDLVAGRFLLPDSAWLFGTLVLSPLLALFGNAMAVVVSSRVLDPRAAQNLAATTVLPLLGLLVVQLAGRIALGPRFYFALALGVAAADVALVFVAVRLFDRERLLTQWR